MTRLCAIPAVSLELYPHRRKLGGESDGDVHGDEFGHELLARDGDRQPSPCRPTTAAIGITQQACLPSSLPRKHVPP